VDEVASPNARQDPASSATESQNCRRCLSPLPVAAACRRRLSPPPVAAADNAAADDDDDDDAAKRHVFDIRLAPEPANSIWGPVGYRHRIQRDHLARLSMQSQQEWHRPVDVIDSSPSPVTRRRWLKRAAAVALAGGGSLAGYAFGVEPHWFEVVHRKMPLLNLSPDLVGKRLVQISDLHIGPIVADHHLWSAFRTIETLEPDLVVITGDIMHFQDSSQLEQASSVLRMLPHGRLGTLAVTGNHDFGPHWGNRRVADKLCRRLRKLGITPLRNESIDFSSLRILGVDDVWSPVGDLQATLSNYSTSQPTIALCHNPDAVDDPAWQDFRGWILSGHTHGGQVWLPGMRPVVPIRNLDYVAGHVQLAEHRHLYVNRAIGYLKRVRFCVRPEITVFELAAA